MVKSAEIYMRFKKRIGHRKLPSSFMLPGSFFDTKPLLTIWTPILAFIFYHLKTHNSNTISNTDYDYLLVNTQVQVSECNIIFKPKTKAVKSKQSRCNSLYHHGKWKDFKAYAFNRVVDNVTLTSIYQPNYPVRTPNYDFSIDQHFTGTWEGENCKIKKLTKEELKTCFKGNTMIKIFGDSRSRQIYHSLTAYLKDDQYFTDIKVRQKNANIPGILSSGYQWSNGIVNKKVISHNKRLGTYTLTENIIKVFKEGGQTTTSEKSGPVDLFMCSRFRNPSLTV